MQVQGFSEDVNFSDQNTFWEKINKFSKNNVVENNLGYMYMMLQFAKKANIKMTKEYLNSLGEKIEFFPGVETWFDRINEFGKENGVEVEHYIISSGLCEIIEGTKISKKFKRIYASAFYYENGEATWPSWVVDYTSKTRYIFRVSKGKLDLLDNSINDNLERDQYYMPIHNIIYIGDSDTDIPSMTLVKDKGGISIGVYGKYNRELEAKLLQGSRIDSYVSADYSKDSSLEDTVKKAIIKIAKKSSMI